MNSPRSLHKLLQVIFPEVLIEYFDIVGWHDLSDKIEVWLDEKNYMERSDYKKGTVISNGFTDEKVIQDFPLRGKPVYLHEDVDVGMTKILVKHSRTATIILPPKERNSLLSSSLF